ncbi:MAG: ADP-ribosylglycohydrolase family protein [bacterium]
MLGAIFGDFVGSKYEFNNIKTTDFELIADDMSITDDSILTIAVADWLLQNSLSKERLISIIKAYVKRYPHPIGGYGCSFDRWAKTDDIKPYNSWGNGSAMRVAAVGWAFDTLERTENVAALTAEITHNHPEGIKGAQAVAAAIFMARNGSTKRTIKQYISDKYGYNLNRSCDEIRPTYSFNESCAGTVPEAIIAFLDSEDFESAIRLAISLGGDSDTLAAITGGIAEAFYGMESTLPTDGSGDTVNIEENFVWRIPKDLQDVIEQFYQEILGKR